MYARPHLADFPDFAFDAFDVGVWTSAGSRYAQGVVAAAFRGRTPRFVYSSQRCTVRRDPGTGDYVTLKRLAKLKSLGYRLEQIIAVDDTPEKHTGNYGNLVHVAEYNGEPHDAELPLLREYLAQLAREPNVRVVEKRGWRERVLRDRST